MTKVYVVNEPLRRDPETGAMTRWMDFEDARRYGEIVRLLPDGHFPRDPAATVEKLRAGLAAYREGDYIVPVGDPTFIGWAIALAARNARGKVRTLTWIPKLGAYVPTVAELW